jgi:CRP-like cAMP-binding protein
MTEEQLDTAKQQLREHLNLFQVLSEDATEAIVSLFQAFSASRKEIITAAGEHERYLYFVLEGVQRVYYFDDAGKEATLVLTYAPSLGGVLDAMLNKTPSRYYYETLTKSVFIRAPFEKIEKLIPEFPEIECLFRVGLSQTLSGLLLRMAELQCFSSEEKFRSLMKRSKHILHVVPHKYLANYIGVDVSSFSKMVNSIEI